jgi:hypothetical protein
MVSGLGSGARLACCAALAAALLALASRGAASQTPTGPAAQPPVKPPAKTPVKPRQKPAARQDGGSEANADAEQAKATRAKAQALLEAGDKSFAAGIDDAAIKSYTEALTAGGLDAPVLARTLYRRGVAQRRQSQSSAAIADLTQALYLKGLSDAERADATYNRGLAYKQAGLADRAEADLKAGRPADAGTAAAAPAANQAKSPATAPAASAPKAADAAAPPKVAAAAPTPAAPAPAPEPPKPASGGVGGFFGSLFGGGAAKKPPEAKPAVAGGQQTAATSAWSASIAAPEASRRPTVAQRPRGTEPAAPMPERATATAPASATNQARAGVRVQVASLRSAEQAKALVGRIRSSHKELIALGEPEVREAVLGSMGTFYQVRLGPFASEQDGQKACPVLRASGLDCLLVR